MFDRHHLRHHRPQDSAVLLRRAAHRRRAATPRGGAEIRCRVGVDFAEVRDISRAVRKRTLGGRVLHAQLTERKVAVMRWRRSATSHSKLSPQALDASTVNKPRTTGATATCAVDRSRLLS